MKERRLAIFKDGRLIEVADVHTANYGSASDDNFDGILTGTKYQLEQVIDDFFDGEGEIVSIEITVEKTQ